MTNYLIIYPMVVGATGWFIGEISMLHFKRKTNDFSICFVCQSRNEYRAICHFLIVYFDYTPPGTFQVLFRRPNLLIFCVLVIDQSNFILHSIVYYTGDSHEYQFSHTTAKTRNSNKEQHQLSHCMNLIDVCPLYCQRMIYGVRWAMYACE